jgi:hypothetical protein
MLIDHEMLLGMNGRFATTGPSSNVAFDPASLYADAHI